MDDKSITSNKMKIVIDIHSLEISSSNVVTGLITLEFSQNSYFPEKGWNDSVIIVLESWLNNLSSVLNEGNDVMEFIFFDGPFSFVIKKISKEYECNLHHNGIIYKTFTFDIYEFACSLIHVSKIIR